MKVFYAGSAVSNIVLCVYYIFSGHVWYPQLAFAIMFGILFYIDIRQRDIDFRKFPEGTYVKVKLKRPKHLEFEDVEVPRKFTAVVAQESDCNPCIGLDVDLGLKEPVYVVVWKHHLISMKKIKKIAPKDIYSSFLKEN